VTSDSGQAVIVGADGKTCQRLFIYTDDELSETVGGCDKKTRERRTRRRSARRPGFLLCRLDARNALSPDVGQCGDAGFDKLQRPLEPTIQALEFGCPRFSARSHFHEVEEAREMVSLAKAKWAVLRRRFRSPTAFTPGAACDSWVSRDRLGTLLFSSMEHVDS